MPSILLSTSIIFTVQKKSNTIKIMCLIKKKNYIYVKYCSYGRNFSLVFLYLDRSVGEYHSYMFSSNIYDSTDHSTSCQISVTNESSTFCETYL